MGWKKYELTISKPRDKEAWKRCEDASWRGACSETVPDHDVAVGTGQVKRPRPSAGSKKQRTIEREQMIIAYLRDHGRRGWLKDIVAYVQCYDNVADTSIRRCISHLVCVGVVTSRLESREGCGYKGVVTKHMERLVLLKSEEGS